MSQAAVATRAPDADVTWTSPHALDMASTLGRLGRGAFDPTHRTVAPGTIWRTARCEAGTASFELRQVARDTVRCRVWGDGAGSVLARLPGLLGGGDDHAGFEPRLPLLAEAHRRHPGLRTPRTGYVLEALMSAVIEQRVLTIDAHAAWRRLHLRFGDPAPGPAPDGMRAPLSAAQWLRVTSWEWHQAGVDARRARTARGCAAVAARMEEAAGLSPADAEKRLTAVPGVGAWTAAEVAQRALGDSDALSVGDFHLATNIGWTFLGHPITDAEMVDLLEPWRPFRYRVVRLLDVSGAWHAPRFGPRSPRDRHYRH